MESHPCEKTRGEGVPGALPMPNPDLVSVAPPSDGAPLGARESHGHQELSRVEEDRCQHVDARGHRCRMFVAPAEKTFGSGTDSDLADLTSDLCAHHAQKLLRRHRAGQTAGAELLASITDFADAASVNRFLGNLARMVALRRIPRRDAIALAYISQLILNSQAAGCRGELQSLQVEALRRQLDPPTRVIWDLPRRKQDPERNDNSKPDENRAGTNTGQ